MRSIAYLGIVKNSTIRKIVLLAALSIAGITVTQLYWVKRAFDLKEDEFERTVTTALFHVAQQIFAISKTPEPSVNPVKQVSTNYFVVTVNSEVNASTVEYLLRTEFEKRNLIVDFEYGVYDCSSHRMLYGNYVPLKNTSGKTTDRKFPAWIGQGYHFGVQFPNREAHLLNQMGIWSFSSVVLLVVIVFFAYTLFVILRQKRLSEIQKDFINNMTHEFKTPISTIALSAEVLKSPEIMSQPDRMAGYVSLIEKENQRLRHHVERVLQMAHMDREVIFTRECVELHEVIREAIGHLTLPDGRAIGNITLYAGATNACVNGDRLHLTNVFNNLFDNAVKYCQESPEITIRTSNNRGFVTVDVSDNGIGIGREHHKRVFQKFYRVPTGNIHDVKGFGLGLSYVKTIVEGHGGSIVLESDGGKGSTFRLQFPVEE